MDMFIIVLQVLLGLVFLLFGFLAVRQYEADRHETFLAAWTPFAGSAMLLTSQKLREKCFEVALQRHLPTYEEDLLRSPSERIEIPLSHGLFSGKDMMMNIHIDAKEQGEMAPHLEMMAVDLEGLAASGFTSEESISLLRLQKWYQTGGSDRVVLLRHWEFLKFLVLNGTLDMEDGVPS